MKFRRQAPIGNYIVDFVCLQKRLVVEVDGGEHRIRQLYNKRRIRWLLRSGFRVVRFWNEEVMDGINEVVEKIRVELET
jgi:very-short-patch-repair endonuclease